MNDILETNGNLSAELELYRTIVDNSLEGIYIVRDHKLEFCNRRFARMYGFEDPRDTVGVDVMTLVADGSRELVEQELAARASGKKDVSHYVFTARRIDGTTFEVETLGRSVMFRGSPAVQGVMRDVSRERQLEQRLRQAQKMEAMGTLAGGIAHDFNNILSVIIGYTELSLDGYQDPAKLHHNLEQMLKASLRAKDLVRQILSFSRQGERKKRPVKMQAIVLEVLKLIRASLPSTIRIECDLSPTAYVVLSDPTQLHQVMMNLCTNAAHAMQENGGVLKVELSDLNRDMALVMDENSAPSPYLRLTIGDTGHGMTAAVKERIFDPFFTTKEPGEGTGMGLSVVHGIIKGLDGEVSVESEPGQGTSFHVFLPLLEAAPVETAEKKKAAPGGRERILLVDDETVLVEMGRKILTKFGYDVVSYSGSPEALEAFRADPDGFDLVLTDLTMPDMTGIELAREMIALRPDIRVVICTGFSHNLDRDYTEDLGIKAVILKPYNRDELAQTIRKVLDKK